MPGVRFAGLIHPGLIGCLPDPKLLDTWNRRETGLIATNPNRVPNVVSLHEPHPGQNVRRGMLHEYLRKLLLDQDEFIRLLEGC